MPLEGKYWRRFTTERWNALRWYADHETDPNLCMGRPAPTRRMANKMIKAGQLKWFKGSITYLPKLQLTSKGWLQLESKHTHRTTGYKPSKSTGRRRLKRRYPKPPTDMDRVSLVPEPSEQSPLTPPPEPPDEPTAPPSAR